MRARAGAAVRRTPRGRGPHRPGRAARRAAGNDGAPHPPAAPALLIGAWCFADHYGPDDVASSGGMDVPPHPHTGLQTVSRLFAGEVEHRDSGGSARAPRRDEPHDRRAGHLPLRGLHPAPRCCTASSCGWPCPTAPATRDLQHHVPDTPGRGRCRPGLPRHPSRRDLAGAHLHPAPGRRAHPRPRRRRHPRRRPVLRARRPRRLRRPLPGGHRARPAELAFIGPGPTTHPRQRPRRAGPAPPARGIPFEEDILMWWNSVGRSHEEIEQFRGTGRTGRSASAASRATRTGSGCRPPSAARGSAPARTPRPRPPRPREAPTPGSPARAAPRHGRARHDGVRRRWPVPRCPGDHPPRRRGIPHGRAAAGGSTRAGAPPPHPRVARGRRRGACRGGGRGGSALTHPGSEGLSGEWAHRPSRGPSWPGGAGQPGQHLGRPRDRQDRAPRIRHRRNAIRRR